MSSRRILDYDPVTRMTTYGSHEDGKMIVYYEQDVEAELEACKYLERTDSRKQRQSQAGEHYAHIPDSIIIKWMGEGFNIYSPEVTMAEIFKRVDRDIPKFKLTSMKHDRFSRWS